MIARFERSLHVLRCASGVLHRDAPGNGRVMVWSIRRAASIWARRWAPVACSPHAVVTYRRAA